MGNQHETFLGNFGIGSCKNGLESHRLATAMYEYFGGGGLLLTILSPKVEMAVTCVRINV